MLTLVVLLGKLAFPVSWWEALDRAWKLGGWTAQRLAG